MGRRRKTYGLERQSFGAAPGTLSVDPEAPAPVVRVMAYGPEAAEEKESGDLAAIRSLKDKYPVVWVNVDGLGDADVIAKLGDVFGLHSLALEDVVNVHQRAKVEDYGETTFVVSRMVSLSPDLETEQVSIFLGKGFVLTFQEKQGDCFDAVRERIRKARGRMRSAGPDYLAYALLDALVDHYFPVLEEFGDRLERVEADLAGSFSQETVSRIHRIKGNLRTLRRVIWPQRESLGLLMRESGSAFTAETRLYLRDCYDHAVQVVELVEAFREQGSDLVNMYMSAVSNRMNEIMKVLTIIATIFIPLTFIAGIYGMNFNPEKSALNMPELNWYWGYPFALGLMASVTAVLVVFFRRRGWL